MAVFCAAAMGVVSQTEASLPDLLQFRMSLNLRGPAASWVEPFTEERPLTLREFELPAPPLVVRLEWWEPETWDWAGVRRKLIAGIEGGRRIRFQVESLVVDSARPRPARSPMGPIVDASTAARVRARLAGDPLLRSTGASATCRDGKVQLTGQFARATQTARALSLALSIDGVREVSAALPEDLAREAKAGR